ncbi:MAG: biotin/lipoyl-binding protein [Gammaproteobacteria bacterium]|nr:biotin/lipoyl-binding protein [Gammaproteobacteria bacterium]
MFVKENQHVNAGDILYSLDKSGVIPRAAIAPGHWWRNARRNWSTCKPDWHTRVPPSTPRNPEVLTARAELERARQDLIRAEVLQTEVIRTASLKTTRALMRPRRVRTGSYPGQPRRRAEAQLGVLSGEEPPNSRPRRNWQRPSCA